MFKSIKHILAARAMRRRMQVERSSLEAWALHFGRDGAEMWLEALAARDAARLSNA